MTVYLFRHGMADFEEEGTGKKIADPGLNQDGRNQVKRVCDKATELGIRPGRILTSPIIRARETADICHSSGWGKNGFTVSENLLPGADPQKLLEQVLAEQSQDSLVLVAHYPILGKLAKKVLGKDLGFHIRNGAVLGLELSDKEHSKRDVSIYLY